MLNSVVVSGGELGYRAGKNVIWKAGRRDGMIVTKGIPDLLGEVRRHFFHDPRLFRTKFGQQ
jgi:hypothetical protein